MNATAFHILRMGLAATLLLQAQCGKSTKSQLVHITVNPPQPIVINSPFTYTIGSTTTTVPAPWFQVQVKIDNESGQTVSFVSLHLEITGQDQSGNAVTQPMDFSPTDANFSITNGTTTTTCNYLDFGQFDPGGSPAGPTSFNDTFLYSKPDVTSSAVNCPTVSRSFYVGGLTQGPPNVYSYSVKVVPVGWFGTRSQAQNRFEGFTTFTTQ